MSSVFWLQFKVGIGFVAVKGLMTGQIMFPGAAEGSPQSHYFCSHPPKVRPIFSCAEIVTVPPSAHSTWNQRAANPAYDLLLFEALELHLMQIVPSGIILIAASVPVLPATENAH